MWRGVYLGEYFKKRDCWHKRHGYFLVACILPNLKGYNKLIRDLPMSFISCQCSFYWFKWSLPGGWKKLLLIIQWLNEYLLYVLIIDIHMYISQIIFVDCPLFFKYVLFKLYFITCSGYIMAISFVIHLKCIFQIHSFQRMVASPFQF